MISLDVVKSTSRTLNDPAIIFDDTVVTFDSVSVYFNDFSIESSSPESYPELGDKLDWLDVEASTNTLQNNPSVTIDDSSVTIDSTSHYVTDFAIQSVMNKPTIQNGDIS